jgi:hypothetical protein
MSAGQPSNGELEVRQVRFDLQTHHGAPTNSAWETEGWDSKSALSGRNDQITTAPKTASVRSHEIKIDETHRILVSDRISKRPRVRAGLIVGAVVASSGLAWIVISTLTSPFGLAWARGLSGYRFLDPSAASSNLQIRSRTIREADREATAQAGDDPKLSSSSASGRGKPSLGTASPAPFTSKHSSVAQQRTTSIRPRIGELQTRAKLTPSPETRPTTIEGWTLREVIYGTAILEGPNGIRMATPGATVPGVGRVNSIVRWGDRWIVATSTGLISTP